MVWPFDQQKPPQNAGTFNIPLPPQAGGADGGKGGSSSKMEYSFDSSALERAAESAKTLENNSNKSFILLQYLCPSILIKHVSYIFFLRSPLVSRLLL